MIDGLVAVTKEDPKPTAAGTKTQEIMGDAVFSNLQLGYYLVIEDSAPEGYVTGSPFLIAVPSTDNYDDEMMEMSEHTGNTMWKHLRKISRSALTRSWQARRKAQSRTALWQSAIM